MSVSCLPSSRSPSAAPADAPAPIQLRGAAAELLICHDEEVLLEGRAGTGKSVGACYKLLWCAQSYPGSHILLARETRRSMTDSILVTLESLIGETHPEVTRQQRDQRHSYRLWGSEIVCAGMDEPSKIYGTGWDLIYLNEAIECSEDGWELFARGTRDPKYRQKGSTRRMPYHQRIADLNPGPPGFWANQRATPCSDVLRRVESLADYQRLQKYNSGPQAGKMRRLVSVHQDNPTWFDFGSWGWNEEGRKQRASLLTMGGPRLQRMFYGLWKAAEGGVYPEFDETRHVCDAFPIPRDWPCLLAKDPGRDHPDATLIAAVAPTGKLYIVAESCVRQTTVEQDARYIDRNFSPNFRIVKKLGDPHMMFSATKFSESGRTIAEQMRDFGHVFERAKAARNQAEMAQQVEQVRTLLTTIGTDGEPMLMVFRGCVNTIRGFQSWAYVRDRSGQMKGGEDRFEDVGDDEMDCVRMLVADQPRFEPTVCRVFQGQSE